MSSPEVCKSTIKHLVVIAIKQASKQVKLKMLKIVKEVKNS